MKKSELRDMIDAGVDEIEDKVGSVLNTLEDVEKKANWDVDAMSSDDIVDLQDAINQAIKELRELSDALY
jgi:hypothetical protein